MCRIQEGFPWTPRAPEAADWLHTRSHNNPIRGIMLVVLSCVEMSSNFIRSAFATCSGPSPFYPVIIPRYNLRTREGGTEGHEWLPGIYLPDFPHALKALGVDIELARGEDEVDELLGVFEHRRTGANFLHRGRNSIACHGAFHVCL